MASPGTAPDSSERLDALLSVRRTPVWRRITSRLVFWFVCVALVPLSVGGAIAYRGLEQSLRQQVTEGLAAIADSRANQLTAYFSERERDAVTLSRVPDVVETMGLLSEAIESPSSDSAEQRSRVAELRTLLLSYREAKDYANLFLVAPDGLVVFSANDSANEGETAGSNVLATESRSSGLAAAFSRSRTLMQAGLSGLGLAQASDEAALFASAPIFGRGRDLLGVVVLQLSNGEVHELAMDTAGLGETGETLIVAESDGQPILVTPTRHEHDAAGRSQPQRGSDAERVLRLAMSGDWASGVTTDYRGREVLAVWRYLPLLHCGMVVKLDASEAYAAIADIRRTCLAVALITALLATIGALAISRSISRPIVSLTRSTRRVAAGDLGAKVAVESGDEVGELAASFNAMAESLSTSRDELEVRMGQLRQSNRQLAEAVGRAEQMSVRAEAADAAKSAFLANMSHEIRTPMTAILGYSEELLEGGDLTRMPPERLNAVRVIRRNGEHLLQIINDILDLSKIEAGRLEVELLSISPARTVAEVCSLMRVRAIEKGLKLSVSYASAIPETIETDPTRLRQILINLIGNAIKFSTEGQVQVVTRLIDEESGTKISFDVIDAGIGMTREAVSRLFQPFSQADSSTARRFGGTGLGLVICRRLVDAMGGTIDVESELGRGSTFRVVLPVGSLEGVALIESPSEAVKGGEITECPDVGQAPMAPLDCRILMAEDGPDNQRLIRTILQRAGAQVEVVEDGRAALERALQARDDREPFDIVLMDMQMPVLDGFQATRALRSADYDLPIIALTAHAMAADRARCLEAGCNDFVAKPIDRARLLQVVARLVESVKRERAS